jgi:hypothetical protein
MTAIELVKRRHNFYQFRPPVYDYEFRRDGKEIVLAFSAKAEVPRDLRVRLYETRSAPTRAERRALIAADQEKRVLGAGFVKSNRFVRADGKQTLLQIASVHGFESAEPLLGHFANRLLRGSTKPQKDDAIFVPQLRSLQAVPLGPVLPVEDVSESVPEGGHRHQARWKIDEQGYDPLDPTDWVPDSLMTLSPSQRTEATIFDATERQVWLPQFAVLTASGGFVDSSPTPPEIVEEAGYQLSGDDPHAFAVLVGKGSRLLSADNNSVAFAKAERPLGAYGAILDEEEA